MADSVFSPVTINQTTIKNRFAVPPMVTNYGNEKGEVTDRHIAYLEKRAAGGFGLITLEATAVLPSGAGFPRGVGLWDDAQIEGLSRLAQSVHRHGARLSVQLYHAGRQTYSAVTGTQVVSASPIPCPSCREVPAELDPPQIRELARAFGRAAGRAKQAGADAVEIHGAHGYLVAQFVSPYSNRRVDSYGGPLHNRLRFPFEILGEIRKATGAEFPVIYRISARERVPGGITLEEALAITLALAAEGVDAFHISTGVYGSMPYIIPNYSLPDGINVEDAAAIKEHTGLPVIVAGKIADVLLADSIISGGRADVVAMGRPSIVDPDLPNKAAAGFLDDIRPCISCNQGCVGGLQGPEMEMSCLVNPTVGKERQYEGTSAGGGKSVVVAGGGPGGLEAARLLAEKGHRVTLFEKSDRWGGQFRVAALPPEKQPLAKLIRWQVDQAGKAGVELHLQTEVTPELVTSLKPDVVVVATGSRPLPPEIPGIAGARVVTAVDVLSGRAATGDSVVILGGGQTGCETADYLAHMQKRVTILEMLDQLATDAEASQRYFLLRRLRDLGVVEITGAKVTKVLDDGVVYEKQGESHDLTGFDSIVVAFGAVADNALAEQLRGAAGDLHVIGDAKEPRNTMEAIRDAARLAATV